jgi:hypothetical protein
MLARRVNVGTSPVCSNGTEEEMHRYAAKVSQGFRPSESKKIPPAVWALVQQCWDQDAELRPSMQHVAEMLQGMIMAGQAQKKAQKQQKQQAPICCSPAVDGSLPVPSASDADSKPLAKSKKLADSKCCMM